MRKVTGSVSDKGITVSLVWALAGQACDVWTTKLGVAHGAREMNPLFRGMVERGQYGKVLALKYGAIGCAAVLQTLAKPPQERRAAVAGSLRSAGTMGFLAGAWNLFVMFRRLHRSNNGVLPQ